MPRRRAVNRSAAPTDAPTSRGSPGYLAKIELRPVAELKVNPRNARTHSQEAARPDNAEHQDVRLQQPDRHR